MVIGHIGNGDLSSFLLIYLIPLIPLIPLISQSPIPYNFCNNS
ncbi:hypothetical protein FDUTEX481_06989 [Tolypothrix sp. PCC 7601]|nr:hypothetical protein FDUTEX481_06989 [Tolypothrix sp. PCC 7601]